ncbi:hypothetical protein F5Y03DRAFT_187255 [Xylaria venustula]|nr:hypothetical protein F5Y03DRAFT_187255 [Xylaria venustula]
MFRAGVGVARLPMSRPRPLKRPYTTHYEPRVHIPLLRPVIWSVGACSTIYLASAAYEVYQDAQRAQAKGSRWGRSKPIQTFEELEHLSGREPTNSLLHSARRPAASERSEFSDSERLTVGIMGAAAGVHVAYNIMPAMKPHFVHTPALSSNYTLLTSVFGHGGLVHLGLNLYGMYHFVPSAADSPTFRGSNAHLTAFYLSAGILSSLAQHVTAIWPQRNVTMSSLGASGALFALFGIVGVAYPNTQIGIIFLPGSLPIGEAMACLALFDAVGIFVRYPGVHLGHAAHLGGLALGVGYAKYGGDKRIWRPGRKLMFNAMRSLRLL